MSARRLADRLPDERSAALVTSPVSIRYLCGAPVDNALMLVFKEGAALFAPDSAFHTAKLPSGIAVKPLSGRGQLLDLLVKYGIRRVFVESDRMTVAEFNMFSEMLHYAEFDSSDFLPTELMRLREVKSPRELALISKAQEICDTVYERFLGTLRKGQTERQIASLLSYRLMEYGAEALPMPVKALSGENTSELSRAPSDRPISSGDFLTLRFGAVYGGYSAVMCRTVCVGNVSSAMENAYHAVQCAMADGLKALRSGLGAKVAESVVRATLNAWSIDKFYVSPFARGIGLELSEPPVLGAGSADMLKASSVLSACCNVAIPGKFGVGIGDMVVITENGCTDLTKAEKAQMRI